MARKRVRRVMCDQVSVVERALGCARVGLEDERIENQVR